MPDPGYIGHMSNPWATPDAVSSGMAGIRDAVRLRQDDRRLGMAQNAQAFDQRQVEYANGVAVLNNLNGMRAKERDPARLAVLDQTISEVTAKVDRLGPTPGAARGPSGLDLRAYSEQDADAAQRRAQEQASANAELGLRIRRAAVEPGPMSVQPSRANQDMGAALSTLPVVGAPMGALVSNIPTVSRGPSLAEREAMARETPSSREYKQRMADQAAERNARGAASDWKYALDQDTGVYRLYNTRTGEWGPEMLDPRDVAVTRAMAAAPGQGLASGVSTHEDVRAAQDQISKAFPGAAPRRAPPSDPVGRARQALSTGKGPDGKPLSEQDMALLVNFLKSRGERF